MAEGGRTASAMRPDDDGRAALADAIVAHGKDEKAPLVRDGPFVVIDDDSGAAALVGYANR